MRYVIYVLSIALITVFLIIYGQAKEYYLPAELTKRLYIKCKDKILKYLYKNKSATYKELEKEIEGVTAKVFWSRKSMTVNDKIKMYEKWKIKMYKIVQVFGILLNGRDTKYDEYNSSIKYIKSYGTKA